MAEISAAINQIDVKKQNLHKSFLHLQSQLPSSFNLPFDWSDLDSYFTTLQSSLQSKFNLLQTLHPPARPELRSFCENSDGLGLNRFIALAPNQPSILSELPDAYRYSPDAPAMVLDAMVLFYNTGQGTELRLFRSGCLIMLEGLLRMNPEITIELKDKAMEMAMQWNRNRISRHDEHEALGFVLLVGAYRLLDRFTIDDIIDCFLIFATDDKSIDLCRRIIPENNIKDMIQNLIYKDMHETAVKFIIQFQKTDEFSLVGLLEERKLRSMRYLEKKRKNAMYLDVWKGVTMIELKTLKSIIKCIDENHIESEYLKDSVVELVNKLENELENSQNVKGLMRNPLLSKSNMSLNESQPNVKLIQDSLSQKLDHVDEVENSKQFSENDLGIRKQPVRASVLKGQLQLKSKMSNKSKKPKLNAVQRTAERALAMPVQNVNLIQESHSQKSDLSPDHVGEFVKSQVVSKSKMLKKSNKPTVNNIQPTVDSVASTPVQSVNSAQESNSHKSDLSPDHGGSAVGSGPVGSNAPNSSLIASNNGSTGAHIGFNFFVQQSQPLVGNNSNGWISE